MVVDLALVVMISQKCFITTLGREKSALTSRAEKIFLDGHYNAFEQETGLNIKVRKNKLISILLLSSGI